MYDEKIVHATFTLPKPEVHPSHPFRDEKNHERMVEYVKSRLMLDKTNRDSRVTRYSQIDRDVAAWVRLSEEDKTRKAKHERDGSPQPTETSLPLAWVHLDDMMTYFAQTFSPNRGMFYHTAKPDSTAPAAQLVEVMNSHAVYGSYYRHILRSIFSILKYNRGGIIANWAKDTGPKLIANPDGSASVGTQTIFSGNKISAIDDYNFFCDPSVEIQNLHKDGEWFAVAEMKSHYWLKNKCLEQVYFNCEEALRTDMAGMTQSIEWYKSPPVESRLSATYTADVGGATNWMQWMTGVEGGMVNNAFELVTMYIRINPNDFGLIPGNKAVRDQRNRYEVWRIVLLNGEKIIGCDYMPNIHGFLPAFFGILHDDWMAESTKSVHEIISPLQDFSSFLLNAHVKATRKNIFGTTFYDPTCIDYDKIPAGEVAARVPLKPQGFGKDIRTMVYHDNNMLDTKQTLQDLQGMMDIVNMFFPTQSLPSQIAGIDRAVDSQVAAVQQGANRRQHKGARIIDDTMMRPMRYCLYYNIIQFLTSGDMIADYFNGTSKKINLDALREASVVDLIGQGLKAIDRQQVAQMMQSIIFALIQAPQAAQGIDMLEMLDFWTSMMDIDTSMKQFALAPEQQTVPPGGEAVGPDGMPIQPATNPESVTAPIYG